MSTNQPQRTARELLGLWRAAIEGAGDVPILTDQEKEIVVEKYLTTQPRVEELARIGAWFPNDISPEEYQEGSNIRGLLNDCVELLTESLSRGKHKLVSQEETLNFIEEYRSRMGKSKERT